MFALEYFKSHIIANRSIYMFTHRVLWHFIARTVSISLAFAIHLVGERVLKTRQRINDGHVCVCVCV